MPYRIAAPPEPDPPEVEEPYAAFLRAERVRGWIRALTTMVLVLGVAGVARAAWSDAPRGVKPTESDRLASARAAIASARHRAELQQDRFAANVRDAILSNVSPAPELGACPIAFTRAEPSKGWAHPLFPLLTVPKSEIADWLPSQTIAGILADVSRAEDHLERGRFTEATLYARALDVPERYGVEVVLVTDENKVANATSGTTYEPGALAGRAYLYDFASGRVICAGDVEAGSSKHVGYMYSDHADAPISLTAKASMSDAIAEDMRLQVENAIIDGLKYRAAPRD